MSSPQVQHPTVVVVEDDPAIATVVSSALEDDGYRVRTAPDGHAALVMVQRQPPDAIVLDLMLPKVDGLQVVRECRAHPATRHIPIIVVSAAFGAQQDLDIQQLVFVEKPFDLDVLMVLVDDAVSSSCQE